MQKSSMLLVKLKGLKLKEFKTNNLETLDPRTTIASNFTPVHSTTSSAATARSGISDQSSTATDVTFTGITAPSYSSSPDFVDY